MSKEKILPVNEASAALFLTQAIGTYSGHMSDIAFSPTLRAIADAHGVNTSGWCSRETKQDFAHLLRMIADELSPAMPNVLDQTDTCLAGGVRSTTHDKHVSCL